MSERRFFVGPQDVRDGWIDLPQEVVLHVGRVLRLGSGDELLLLDGSGGHYRCRIESLAAKRGKAIVLEQWSEGERVLPIQLIQALPKADRFDLVLQKGTELGISRFTPVCTTRGIASPGGQKGERKRQRWQRIVTEAARQSCRPVRPECDAPAPLEQALNECRAGLKLVLWESDGEHLLASRLPETAPASAALLVGPEGGLTDAEVRMARAAGFLTVGLGPRILRTETAGFAVTAILEYLYGDFGSGDVHQN